VAKGGHRGGELPVSAVREIGVVGQQKDTHGCTSCGLAGGPARGAGRGAPARSAFSPATMHRRALG
jgi:hypothetical protein